jgi:hypothetical protein
MFELGQYNQVSFSAHNEMMKRFHKTHVKIVMAYPTRVKQHTILSITVPSAANCTGLDGGGSHSTDRLVNWAISLPLAKVAVYKLSPN